MIGKMKRQEKLFFVGSIRKLIPDEHILVKVDKVLDLSWLEAEVASAYCLDNGRPSIAPEAAVRLMLAGFFQNIVHDRALMREAQVNLAIRWFAGYGLEDEIPHASNLTRLRQRWGAALFKRIFQRTVAACLEAGLVGGDTLHMDSTLIRANVSWESLTTEYSDRVWDANQSGEPESESAPPSAPSSPTASRPGPAKKEGKKKKKRSRTDPEASMATNRQDRPLEPSYKQHTVVDDKTGVIVAVEVTTGEKNEGEHLLTMLAEAETNTGCPAEMLTGDGAYGHSSNYRALEKREIEALIPPPPLNRKKRFPLSLFQYDARHQLVRCPRGKKLYRSSRAESQKGWVYRARSRDCRSCPWRKECVPKSAAARTVLIGDDYEFLVRARRRHQRWGPRERGLYDRHRARVEGVHGEGKTCHGLRRAVRWGLENMKIQDYLTAAVINLKRLATHGAPPVLPVLLKRAYLLMNTCVDWFQKNFWPRKNRIAARHAVAAG